MDTNLENFSIQRHHSRLRACIFGVTSLIVTSLRVTSYYRTDAYKPPEVY